MAHAVAAPTIFFNLGPVPGLGADPGASGAQARGDQGRLTLDELIVGVWEGLRADHAAECPVCGGAMVARFAAGPLPVAGSCRRCGSALS
ncbi:unannotated protein [freshwater metagenome]|uniref:Unannotated protein n=1 Tax=freshwater metagenome TaxID=449393 RepID=A0A6J7HI98_9ZZZZ|nr:hypothetical protein [Actinomycetota bacterium]